MANGAILVVGNGRYVIRQFTDTDYIVVARATAAYEGRATVTKGASTKGAGSVANAAILGGIHVRIERGGKRHTASRTCPIRNMTGKAAITVDTSMIKDSVSKTLSVMTRPAIFGSILMSYRKRRRYRVNASGGIVA